MFGFPVGGGILVEEVHSGNVVISTDQTKREIGL